MNIGKKGNKYTTKFIGFVRRSRPYFFGIFAAGLIIDVFLLNDTAVVFSLALFTLAILLIWAFGIKYYITFRIMGAFLLFAFLFLLFSNEVVAEKIAIWAYLFFLIGAAQYLAKLRTVLS